MTQASLNHQFREVNRLGLTKKELIAEIKTYWPRCNWHTVQNYFMGNAKMQPDKRLMLESAISDIIKKRT